MFKACSKCGRIHASSYECSVGKVYKTDKERKLRSTYKWTKKARDIKEKANYLCEVCRDKGIYTYENLEVHHIAKLRDNPEKLLDDYNLVCLCSEHHHQADNGEIEPAYLLTLAEQREERN